MREIKFKAKNSDGKWVEGYYLEVVIRGELRFFIIPHNVPCEKYAVFVDLQVEIDHNTLSQFTGLTDKNGKEIYEGDIYFIDNKDYCISFYSGCFVGHRLDASALISSPMGWCYDEDSEGELVIDYFYKQIEVIGNIHDK